MKLLFTVFLVVAVCCLNAIADSSESHEDHDSHEATTAVPHVDHHHNHGDHDHHNHEAHNHTHDDHHKEGGHHHKHGDHEHHNHVEFHHTHDDHHKQGDHHHKHGDHDHHNHADFHHTHDDHHKHNDGHHVIIHETNTEDVHENVVNTLDHHDHHHLASSRPVVKAEERSRLIGDLFKNYDKRSYPTNNTLRLGFALVRFDVDEEHNAIDVDGFIRESWEDPRLTWDPKEYGGESILRIPLDQVWKPDTTLYNSALSRDTAGCRESNVIVYSNGEMLWVPPCQYKAYCNLTLDIEPFGEQKCGLKFGSWTFDGNLLDLQFYKDEHKVDTTNFFDNSDYEIVSTAGVRHVMHYACCAEPYPYIEFDFTFHRKRNTHYHKPRW